MHCPTCASPLPVGAMFCGECGRAVTSADVEAARAAAGEQAAQQGDAQATPGAAPPTWQLRRPERPLAGEEQPWWVRDRQAGPVPSDDAPPAWAGSGAGAGPVSVPAATRPGEAPVEPAPEDEVVEAPPAAGPEPVRQPEPPRRVPAPPAAPLRTPQSTEQNGPRPSSAPLWTASLAPVPASPASPPPTSTPAPAPAPAPAAGETAPDDDGPETTASAEGEPEAQGASSEGRDGQLRRSTTDAAAAPDEEPVSSAADVSGSSSTGEEHAEVVSPGAAPVAPVPLRLPGALVAGEAGDTAPVTPVRREAVGALPTARPDASPEPGDVAPVPLVEPGQAAAVERCTHCGALIHEDDIFCGECGAVVQSVALSFTGPVTPLPPSWRPDAPAPTAPAGADDPTSTPARPDEVVADAGVRPGPSASPADEPLEPRRSPVEPASGHPEPVLPVFPPMPPAPPSHAGWRPSPTLQGRPDDDDDVEATRLVRRGPAGTPYHLQFSTGESITVDGAGLLGRAPVPQPGERFDHLVRIVDPGKSVSKTHLEFGQDSGALWISDRWSGNGTVVRPLEAPARRVEPGTRVRVARGTRVEIGEQSFVVS